MNEKVSVQAVVQARFGSTRLEGKIMAPICGRPLLGWVIERLRAVAPIKRIVLATSTRAEDDRVEEFAESENVPCVRGPLDDVLGRFLLALERYPASAVVRATGDNPLLDAPMLERLIEKSRASGADYTGCAGPVPRGTVAEVVRVTTVERSGSATGGVLFFTFGGMMAGPAAFGILAAATGSMAIAYAATAVLVLPVAVLQLRRVPGNA